MPSARDILRSHAAVSPLTFAFVAVILALAPIAWTGGTGLPANLVVLNGLSVVALVGLIFLVGARIAARWYAGRPLPAVMVVLMAVLVVVAATTPIAVEALLGLDGVDSDFVWRRVVPARPSVAVVYLLAVYVVGLREWYAGARNRALDQLVQARAASLAASDAVVAAVRSTADDARSMSSESRQAADEMLRRALVSVDPAASEIAAGAVRDAARGSVRASSHRLWGEPPAVQDSIPWGDIVTVSLRVHPLPLAAVAVMAMYGALVWSGRVWGIAPAGGLLTGLVAIVLFAVSFLAGRAIIRRWPSLALPVTVPAVVIPVLVAAFVPGLVDPAISAGLRGVGAVSISIAFLAVVVASALLLTARDSAGAVITGLQEARRGADVERRALDEVAAKLRRDVAQHVHGTVQPGLIAASFAIDDALGRGDLEALTRALSDARVALDVDFTPQAMDAGLTLPEVAEDLRAQWAGLLDVQYEGALPVLRPDATAAFREIAQECLNNAFIHGGARSVVVSMTTESDGSTAMRITDDGSGPGTGPPGLGSAIMTNATHGQWSIAPANGGGTVVLAVIP